ncbi:Acetyl-CoA acetyltransferase, mitochondrial [Hondaea fermentalgiana]|uniref:Acetyl-CoA acetyltransferase, mitochondrial n=1 Tax=Hondaea fermentalgiana TaxID=2315210 RepID=A0A2R5G2W0_9STRA|nr:Acetyl-CoA acetyltransferase, mitochondrial [Hondaea fermentalgiana]|eukprot:GBG24865.1 Acetyl-CoA acetyltransferase, mitochondrial [Hondaea fermentalgiana]
MQQQQQQERACIVGVSRTPFGSFGGVLSKLSAPKLGSAAIKGALQRAGVKPDEVNEVFMGQVVSAGAGQAPARQASLGAGIPIDVPCTTVNKVCSSGMKAIMFGAQSIKLGENDVVVCGGFESMSNVPFYSPSTRFGSKFGDASLIDGLARDGLRDAYTNEAMGCAGSLCAASAQISRQEQDEYAAASYARARKATIDGVFKNEITPLEIPGKRGKTTLVSEDEEPMLREITYETLSKLPPAFEPHAKSVTAGNSSVLSDGAAAVVLASESYARKHGLPILAYIDSYADAANPPEEFTTAPTKAAHKALARAGTSVEKMDLFEFNEAFSVVALVNARNLGIPADKINVHGGAVSIGHPLGASGARIVMTLITALERYGKERGCAAICNGGGGASAMVISRPTKRAAL